MKKTFSFLIWFGIALSALLAITSALSNIILMFSAFPDSIGDKYAYIRALDIYGSNDSYLLATVSPDKKMMNYNPLKKYSTA